MALGGAARDWHVHAQRQIKGHRKNVSAALLAAPINAFEANKRLADRAVVQAPDDKLHVALGEETNSIAVIMKYVAGNLLSRWTDFLTTDDEKPGRNRDDECVDTFGAKGDKLDRCEKTKKSFFRLTEMDQTCPKRCV